MTLVLKYLFLVGIEDNFREKCKNVKDLIESLKTHVEMLENNQAKGYYYNISAEIFCQVAYMHCTCVADDDKQHSREPELKSERVECDCNHGNEHVQPKVFSYIGFIVYSA